MVLHTVTTNEQRFRMASCCPIPSLASNTSYSLLSSEDAADPNLIDIEDLTCSSGEILVSNTSFIEGSDTIALSGFFLTALPTSSCSDIVYEQRDRRRFHHCHSW